MGRLMLNVLLSFAQFEREITGERIRDKIAASKKKGMWMGGIPPMGYDVKDRQLVVNEQDAATIRRIFGLYLEAGNCASPARSPGSRTASERPNAYSAKGNHYGDRPFTRGHLYKLLANPIYVGRVPHGKTSHRGLHAAIIDKAVWDAVQALLEQNTQGSRERRRRAKASAWMLDGLLRSDRGNRFVASHATKGVSTLPLLCRADRRRRDDVWSSAGEANPAAAREIEAAVIAGLKSFLCDHRGLMARFEDLAPAQKSQLIPASKTLVDVLSGRIGLTTDRTRSDRYFRPLSIGTTALLWFSLPAACFLRYWDRKSAPTEGSNASATFSMTVPLTHRHRGPQMKLAVAGHEPPAELDQSLVTAVVRARDWADRLISGEVSTMAEICADEGFSDTYVGQLLPLAFLAPALVERILQGTQLGKSTDKVLWDTLMPTSWAAQPNVL